MSMSSSDSMKGPLGPNDDKQREENKVDGILGESMDVDMDIEMLLPSDKPQPEVIDLTVDWKPCEDDIKGGMMPRDPNTWIFFPQCIGEPDND